ncbi:MAG TPA: tetratricopeptide repeat-containing glycosyltransferase family protein [Rhodopila sp.]|jgi:Flp pilus assembly protein TadD
MPGERSVDDPASLFRLGNTLAERGQTEAAIEAFQRCLALAPDRAAAHFNLGNALRQTGRPVDAIDAFLACLRLVPHFGAAYVNLAESLRRLGLLEQAREMAVLAVRHLPEQPEAMICLANVLHDLAEYAASAELYAQALAREPDHAGALTSLGNSLHALGRLDEALAVHDRAVAAAPYDPDFHFNRAATRLIAGDFAGGWEDYQWRRQRSQCKPRGFGEPWQGEDITGRTILLHSDQGLGDTLQFVRYAPIVAARGCRVVLEVQPSLVRLLRQVPGAVQVVPRGEVLPPFDVHCALMSLPRAFKTTLATIPAPRSYIYADPAATAAWKARIPETKGLRIGLVWAGGSHRDDAGANVIDRLRSLPLAKLAPLGDLPNLHLFSLQKHDPEHACTPPSGLTLTDLMADVDDFTDTAALVANLDLVITVDTSVAHLAGSMGRPIWLLLRYNGCWRWLHDREDSPWYPSMRIYRQPGPHDWPAVIARVRQDLNGLVRAPTLGLATYPA